MKLRKLFYLILLTVPFACEKGNDHSAGMHAFNGSYSGVYLEHISFPMGGVGAGMICLEGNGALAGFSPFNFTGETANPYLYTALMIKGQENMVRVLEGPVPNRKIAAGKNAAYGLPGTTYGLPRFERAVFQSHFPFATVILEDREFPVKAEVTGWSPFIPGDADNSSLPVAAMEYRITNTGSSAVEGYFSFHAFHLVSACLQGNFAGWEGDAEVFSYPGGWIMHRTSGQGTRSAELAFAVFVKDHEVIADRVWPDGNPQDISREIWKGLGNSTPVAATEEEGKSAGGSFYIPVSIASGQSVTIPLLLAWYAGNNIFRDQMDTDKEPGTPEPWYLSKFNSMREVANYWKRNYDNLRDQSARFSDALYSTTLPPELVEAVTANLSVLLTPGVGRGADGRLDYRLFTGGSCDPDPFVRNFDQAIPRLFPQLSRAMAEENLAGAALTGTGFQPGDILSVYREWRSSGDTPWAKKNWPAMLGVMGKYIESLDPAKTGILKETWPHPYAGEWSGPEPMGSAYYLGALSALVEMGEETGMDPGACRTMIQSGKKFFEDSLFNGEYFCQRSKKVLSESQIPGEGIPYQYGSGCLSGALSGCWMARMSGLEEIIDPMLTKSHLLSVVRYNFTGSAAQRQASWRPGYAMGNETGLMLCSWPAEEPSLPSFPAAEEVWTGVEYQVASHLMTEGLVEEGLKLVRAVRRRYDGRYRNPFGEYCNGPWSPRALASFSLLQGLTGVRYDALTQTIYLSGNAGDYFRVFLSTDTGFGVTGLKDGKPFLEVYGGDIPVSQYFVAGKQSDE